MSEQNKEPQKVIPSKLERKFADFNYKFAKYIPEKVEPNTLTGIGFFIGLIGAILFAFCKFNKWIIVLSILGCLTHIVCDNLDGYIARTRNKKSAVGGYIDLMSDIIVCTSFIYFIGLSGQGHMNICALGLPLYGVNMVIAMHDISTFNEFRFPEIGPFEVHLSYLIICLICLLELNYDLFTIFNQTVNVVDVIIGVGSILSLIFITKFGLYVKKRMAKEIDKK